MRGTAKTVFVLGNGPSVLLKDLDACKDYSSIVANRFHLSYPNHALRPEATVCIDPQMISDHIREITQNCQSHLFVPRQFFPQTLLRVGPAIRRISFFPFDRCNRPLRFSFDINSHSGNGASVIFTALQLAVSKGSKEIFLYGMDHNFQHSPPDASGRVRDEGERNHFIAGYRGKGKKWFPPDIERIEEAFRLANSECSKKGIKVWNASRGGNLEIFERIEFEDALQRAETCANV